MWGCSCNDLFPFRALIQFTDSHCVILNHVLHECDIHSYTMHSLHVDSHNIIIVMIILSALTIDSQCAGIDW